MFESILIENFQKHKKLRIDFDKHCTVIVGPTDRGKSAVLRALKWICTNKPSGDAFIKHGSSFTRCTLKVDGHTIIREKGKGVNSYSLDGKEYHALGQAGIPEEIAKILNISLLNFQSQLDGPFWFMLSPGEVSRQINQIINLQLIDQTLGNVSIQLRKVRSTVQVCEERLEESQKKVKELAWSKGADEDLRQIEEVYKRLRDRKCRIDLLREIVGRVEELQQQRDRLSIAKEDAQALIRKGEDWIRQRERVDRLEELIGSVERRQEELTDIKNQWKELSDNLDKELDGKCPLCKQPMKESV